MPLSHGLLLTTSRGPRRSQLNGNDVQRSTTLVALWRLGLSSGPQARSSLEPLRRRWSMTVTLPLWFRRTIPTTMRISLCLRFVLQDLAFFFYFFIFFYCVRFGGFGLCFTVSVKFLFFFFFFFLYLCLCLVAQKMWKRNGNLDFGWSSKKPT